ncbi:Riboflavin biosynthesis protein PYRD, chloroplastic [Linum perenne]
MHTHILPLANHTPVTPLCFSYSRTYIPAVPPAKVVLKFNMKASGLCNSFTGLATAPGSRRITSEFNVKCCGELVEGHGSGREDDGFYIRRSVEIARKAIGRTSPNPMVGCVIVKDGKIVGEGFHPKAGQPHAEVFALRDAGELAENATAYVSLEPCNHYGRTPPCTEALIKAKVKKVVVGMVDPNPIVASKGVDKLRAAGIDVTVGVEEELCWRLNEPYIHKMLTGKPFVTIRYSISLNGNITNQTGRGVTECGGYYSRLLQEYDAVVLSSSSTEQMSLPVSQEPGANQPLWIITASSPSPVHIPSLDEQLDSKVIVFADKESAAGPSISHRGIETVVLDHLNLDAVLEYCNQQGLCSVLLDLRGSFGLQKLVEDSIERGMVQKVVVEVLPVLDGTGDDLDSLPALKTIRNRIDLKKLEANSSHGSIVLEGYL